MRHGCIAFDQEWCTNDFWSALNTKEEVFLSWYASRLAAKMLAPAGLSFPCTLMYGTSGALASRLATVFTLSQPAMVLNGQTPHV